MISLVNSAYSYKIIIFIRSFIVPFAGIVSAKNMEVLFHQNGGNWFATHNNYENLYLLEFYKLSAEKNPLICDKSFD